MIYAASDTVYIVQRAIIAVKCFRNTRPPSNYMLRNMHRLRKLYADDIVLLGDSFEAGQDALVRVERYAVAVGLRINAAKTKVLSAQVAASQQRQLFLKGFHRRN